jgi:hypothetical protein
MFITLSSTKLEIRAKQFLFRSEELVGKEGVGEGRSNDQNIVCTSE